MIVKLRNRRHLEVRVKRLAFPRVSSALFLIRLFGAEARDIAAHRAEASEQGGDWRRVSYAEALRAARSIAQALLDRGLSVERPVAILSDNDIEHLLLGLGAMLAGVPFAPVSSAYSLLCFMFPDIFRRVMDGF